MFRACWILLIKTKSLLGRFPDSISMRFVSGSLICLASCFLVSPLCLLPTRICQWKFSTSSEMTCCCFQLSCVLGSS